MKFNYFVVKPLH